MSCVKKGENDIYIVYYIATVVTSKNCTLPRCLSVLQFNFLVTKMSILRISDLVDILWHLRLFAFFSNSGCFSWLFLRHGIMTSTSTLKTTHFFPPQKARLLLERLQSAGFPTSKWSKSMQKLELCENEVKLVMKITVQNHEVLAQDDALCLNQYYYPAVFFGQRAYQHAFHQTPPKTLYQWSGFFLVEPLPFTVDGSEIRRSPADVGNLSPWFYQGFCDHPRWLALGFLNHQQITSESSWPSLPASSCWTSRRRMELSQAI